jgi:PTH1 family peptidyl-tRNA hydrolase
MTRHNIGFLTVEALAERLGISFREEGSLGGRIAKGRMGEEQILLLEPMSYMNLSGQSVRRVCDYYKILASEVIVVADDVALPFGRLRLREKGSAGGHNGLKSVQAHLGTDLYMRLKVGVGDSDHGALADHVLGRFSAEEQRELPKIILRGMEVLEQLLRGEEVSRVMNLANAEREGSENKQNGCAPDRNKNGSRSGVEETE